MVAACPYMQLVDSTSGSTFDEIEMENWDTITKLAQKGVTDSLK